jgi:hypothetical protein
LPVNREQRDDNKQTFHANGGEYDIANVSLVAIHPGECVGDHGIVDGGGHGKTLCRGERTRIWRSTLGRTKRSSTWRTQRMNRIPTASRNTKT